MSSRVETVALTGVSFDGWGRPAGQAQAPAVLREAGLAALLSGRSATADITASPPDPTRGPGGFVNERALIEMVSGVYDRVRAACDAQQFPLLYGADCAVLLGAVPALRDHYSSAGLLLIDAHEDATMMEASDGEAASVEIALLLGLTGASAPEELRRHLPALDFDDIVMVGQRDQYSRDLSAIDTISKQVRLHPVDMVHPQLDDVTTTAVAHLDHRTPAWWLHVDLDVLRGDEFPACAAASDTTMPGGLTWTELTLLVEGALQSTKCRGLSVGVYNPDLDPDRRAARDVTSFFRRATRLLEGPPEA